MHLFQKKKLYREIKLEIKDWQQLLDDLWADSDLYNSLLEGDLSNFSNTKYGEKIYPSIEALRVMGVSQCYVLLLSILRNADKLNTNPQRIIKFLELFTFQYSTMGKQPTNRVERIYSQYAIKIEHIVSTESEKNISKLIQSLFASLIKELKSLLPPKEIFVESFMNMSYRNSEERRKLITYILSSFEQVLTETDEFIINYSSVNIEHLLPQNPSKEWDLKKKDIKGYVNLLGNLTLLSRKINSKVQNDVIEKKLSELEKSELKITQEFVSQIKETDGRWGKEEITKRHKGMAEKAFSVIWSVEKF